MVAQASPDVEIVDIIHRVFYQHQVIIPSFQ